jgi:putative membrane-bound dehydrogenase-like protein
MSWRILAYIALWSLVITLPASPAGLSPQDSLKQFRVPADLEVRLSASEPQIRQPVNVMFDERGRMWVIQYLQYPAPAGLKPVSVDQYLRTKYDRVPEPPPKGPRGADRVTILEDKDGDGFYESAKDFADGLNLASGMEIGFGGVWVAQAPYLLFYPDKNQDDVPDSDPEVILTGFGMEDAHAVVNSLTWGPDGWLYGGQGSTCTGNVQGQGFHQAAWRYHPRARQFEVFSEGGGNTFGLEWDPYGNLLTGTNYNNYVMVHYVQGGYFIKNFTKHGALHNPYTFGYFDHVPHAGWRGGHVTQLGVVYQGGALPEKYNGKWIAPNLLANNIDYHTMTREGSTFVTKFEGEFAGSDDKAFRPVDIVTGPDGAIYVADWCDIRANHVIPEDTWDRSNGRVYRISAKGAAPQTMRDLSKLSSSELVGLLSHPNDWYARMSRRILSERRDTGVHAPLRKLIEGNEGRIGLQALWALHVSGALDDRLSEQLLDHADEHVRAWTVRLLGDEKRAAASVGSALRRLAASEKSAVVRSQLASSAKRLPAQDGLSIVRALLLRGEDAGDRYIPLLLWWAIENKATSDREEVLSLFDSPEAWASPLVRKHILERVARRYAAERSKENLEACAKLLAAAPDEEALSRLIAGMDKGLEGSGGVDVPASLLREVRKVWDRREVSGGIEVVRLSLRLNIAEAESQALRLVQDRRLPRADRVSLIEGLGQTASAGAEPALLALLDDKDVEVQAASIAALQRFPDSEVASRVLARYPWAQPKVQSAAWALLSSRVKWSTLLLDRVESGQIEKIRVPVDAARRITFHGDDALAARVAKLWPAVNPETAKQKQDDIARVRQVLSEGVGDAAKGKVTFTRLCSQCHRLFGEGQSIGPDLAGADRGNVDSMLNSIIDPNASIRPEFATWTLKTKDRRVLDGPIVGATPEAVMIEDGGTRVTVPRSQIERLEESPVSRMPEKLLDGLGDDDLRDFFAYLARDKSAAK